LLNYKKSYGRANSGQIVSFYRGGGFKKHYRKIDFCRVLWNMSAVVLQLERDPYRSSFIGLICYQNGVISYIIASEGLKVGSRIYIGFVKYKLFQSLVQNFFKSGNALILKDLPEGILIHLIEGYFSMRTTFLRAGGVSAKLLRHLNMDLVLVRFPSKEEYLFFSNTLATVGQVSNIYNKFYNKCISGVNRRLGRRPVVRGIAKNPVDHPHGGGEGRSSGGRGSKCQVNRWSKVAKGKPTRVKTSYNSLFLYLSRKDKSIRRPKK